MENNVVLFEKNTVAVFEEMRSINAQKKALEEKENQARELLKKACDEFGIKSFKNDIVTISNVDEKTTISLDVEAFKSKEPKLYNELLQDYSIVTLDVKTLEKKEPDTYKDLLEDYKIVKTTAGYVRITYK